MRKKIALYANGWNNDMLQRTIRGMRRYDKKNELDLFVFNCFASYGAYEEENLGDLTVYDIPHVEDYDGIVVFSNSLVEHGVSERICKQAIENNVPVVSLGTEIEGASYVGVDNNAGMRELVHHLVKEHDVKRVAYIGGNKEHPDSNERLQITKEVLGEYGLSIAEDEVYYGNWTYFGVIDVLLKMLDREDGLPDVIVCANDNMALAAISELAVRGYEVPRDILVTGFDYVEEGKHFYPSLTSVEQDFEQVGEYCYQILLGDTAAPVMMSAESKAVYCESCGCYMDGKYEKVRHAFCKKQYSDSLRGEFILQTERSVENAIIETSDMPSLKNSLEYHYRSDKVIEGTDFHAVLDPRFFLNILEDYKKVLDNGILEELSVLVSMRGDELQSIDKVNRHELIPGYDSEENAHTYYVNALHMDRYNIGYFVFVDNPFVVTDNAQYSYVNRICQALHALRINMRLDALNKNLMALYNKDAMTGLYNRFGYENLAVPLFEQRNRLNEKVMVCFLDINSMKHINDVYGHLQGDMAIVIVANAIKRNERGNWIAIRYGGDEFLIIAACGGEDDAESVKTSILNTVEEIVKERCLPYDLSVSCGYVLTEPHSGLNLQDYIKAADEVMYEIKREIHSRD